MIKVITGLRRSGKSYLLFNLFYQYLIHDGVPNDHVITIDLENRLNKSLRNPDTLLHHVLDLIKDQENYYILLDEVQLVPEFEDVLNSFLKIKHLDVYVTGSNAKFLSKDVITEFRGRGDEIKIRPLSFKEFCSVKSAPMDQLLIEYLTYGGMPQVAQTDNVTKKADYLKGLFAHTYLKDIRERYNIKNDDDLEDLINLLASNIGGLTNPTKLERAFLSIKHKKISADTIKTYLDLLQDAFLVEKSVRYDIKGKKYLDTPAKYYFEDLGLRNARIGFRQTEITHLMENAIYNELRLRGFSVDVGQVFVDDRVDGQHKRATLEVDFVCNHGYKRYYIQSAYILPTEEKMEQETASLKKIRDEFQKVIIVGTPTPTYQNEDGILIMNIQDFLMNENSLLL